MSDQLKFLVLFVLFAAFYVVDVHAQQPIYLEDEGTGLWQQDAFIESDGEGDPLGSDGSGEYISDDRLKALEEAARMGQGPKVNIAQALEKERRMLPDNLVYGLGTGLMLGGWVALLEGGNARDNTRYLGIGLVGGVLISMAVGTKSVYQPLLKSQAPPPKQDAHFAPVLLAERQAPRAGMAYRFRF